MLKKIFPFLIFLFCAFFFFFRFLDGLEVFAFKDLTRFFYPLRYLMVEQVKSGHFPLWNPFIFCGMPFLATLQICFFYPLTLIYYVIPFALAFNYYIIIHYFLASVFMYLLMRHYKCSLFSSIFSALVFSYSGYMLSIACMNTTLSSVIWLPLVILFWDRLVNSDYAKFGLVFFDKSFIGIVFSLAMMFLGGEPTIIYVSLWVLFFYGIFLGRNKVKSILILGLVSVFVFGLVSVQLFPFLEVFLHSDRAMLTEYELISRRSFPPKEILNFFLPFFYGDQVRPGNYLESVLGRDSQDWLLSTYVGVIPFIFAFFSFYKRDKKLVFFYCVFIFSLLLAFGRYFPLYPILYKIVPGISFIRYPIKYLFLFFFSLSFLSGVGFERFFEAFAHKENFAKNMRVFIFILLSFVFTFVYFSANEQKILSEYYLKYKNLPPYLLSQMLANIKFNISSLFNMSVYLFVVVACMELVRRNLLKVRLFMFIILGILFLDIFSSNASINLPASREIYSKTPNNISFLLKDPDLYRYFYQSSFEAFNRRIYGDDLDLSFFEAKDRLVANWALPYEKADFYGYESIVLGDYKKYVLNFWDEMFEKRRAMFNSLNIKYFISGERLRDKDLKLVNKEAYFYGESFLYKNTKVVPRGYIVFNCQYFPDRASMLKKIRENYNFNPLNEIYLEGIGEQKKHVNGKQNVEIKNYSYDSLVVDAYLDREGFLYLGDVYYPGWKVFVDGREDKLLRGNLIFRAVKLSPGKHLVKFQYDPLSFKLGAIVSLVFSGFILFFIVKSLFMEKKLA